MFKPELKTLEKRIAKRRANSLPYLDLAKVFVAVVLRAAFIGELPMQAMFFSSACLASSLV